MSVFTRYRLLRRGSFALWFLGLFAGPTAYAGDSAGAAAAALGERPDQTTRSVYAAEYASAAQAIERSGRAEPPGEHSSAPRRLSVERAISEAVAPPRRRCVELRAAINQAATDANGSRGMNAAPPFGRDPHTGANRLPPASVGAIDKRSRLDDEYRRLDCARQAP
jgi:hypothetical protein